MQFTDEQLRVLLAILQVYIPIAAPYADEELIETARKIQELIIQELDNDR